MTQKGRFVLHLCVLERVGIRELRQSLSHYIRRVAEGERFLVTEHREPVAVLGPPPRTDDPWERLIAEGRVSRHTADLLAAPPPVQFDDPYAGTMALEEMRGERGVE